MRTPAIERALLLRLAPQDAARLRRAASLAARRGKPLWLVGGPLRDLLAGRRVTDLDLAIDAGVARLARTLACELSGRLRWHARFSTARIDFDDGHLDLARTRVESYAAPAALPVVRPARIERDLARRDFSVNAMALEIRPRGSGTLLDPFDGRADLRDGVLRVLHRHSFRDDPTRAFRAARFATRFGFRLDTSTRRQLEAAIARGDHERLGGERTARELRLVLHEQRPAAALATIARWGLATAWGTGAEPTAAGLRALRYAAGRLARLGVRSDARAAACLAAAFHELPRDLRERMARRLRLRRDEREALVEGPARARAIVGRLRRTAGRPGVDRVCTAADPRDLLLAGLLADGRVFGKLERWWHGARRLRLAIDGHDLRTAGIPEGPAVAGGLRAARAAFLAGRAKTREAQLRAALRAARRT